MAGSFPQRLSRSVSNAGSAIRARLRLRRVLPNARAGMSFSVAACAAVRLSVAACVAVGLLHDVLEDTLTDENKIKEHFGPDVLHIVEGVTKISKIPFSSSEERQAENFRKLLLAMVDDVRVIIVKLADRLHNMRTLQYLPPDRRQRIARETMDIYAPLAGRLGMSKIKNELEDLSFQYLEPEAYRELVQQATDRTLTKDELEEMDAYRMAGTVEFGVDAKQELLELRSENARLRLLALLLRAAIKRLELVERAQARASSNGRVRFA